MYTLKGREGVKVNASISCFYDVTPLFKRVQGERDCLKIAKFGHTDFMDGLIIGAISDDWIDNTIYDAITYLACAFSWFGETQIVI